MIYACTKPTTAQLQATFERLRKPDWPTTLAGALAHPWYSRLVRCAAHALTTTATPEPARNPAPSAWHRAPAWDARRAAANDRDE